ncbi:hypothetical protein GLAREA_12254 [Glarea lozoyensis ATCC 20868]|uniref:Uncharacterized protein n=1 Tax=Glarea lozoyensis (strain ATCC 20868 / MF5171) TaxID=1116229 RepID=S3DYR6_GLAL2|nr:uncharacterized protein GLAREA_12254 [Glarea lozoyensis ATCC 20868]EPE31498.1 hypothetical protein GLAREA_12254 [Glarea lozoyensis ATCC 20868]
MEKEDDAAAKPASKSWRRILQIRNHQNNSPGLQGLSQNTIWSRSKIERENNAKENRDVCETKHISELRFQIKEEAKVGRNKDLGSEPQLKVWLPAIRLRRNSLSSTVFSAAHDMSMIPSSTNWQEYIRLNLILNKAIQRFVAMRRIQGIKRPVMNNRTTFINKNLLDLGTSRIEDANCRWGAWTCVDDMHGIKVEYKEKEWAEDLLYQDSKYGWFVPRRPSSLRWSWTIEVEELRIQVSEATKSSNSDDGPLSHDWGCNQSWILD